MITFQVESWAATEEKMKWLWPLHWEEVANDKEHIKLDVWRDAYLGLEQSGELLNITVRDGEKIIGYHWSILRPHLHYKTSLTAYTDIYFLHPDYREGMNGMNLFKFVEGVWKERGVQKAYTASKIRLDKSAIFERLGWHKAETVYTKYLGG